MGEVILNYSLPFSKSLFHSLFPSFCRANVCLPVAALCVNAVSVSLLHPPPLILLFSESEAALLRLHDVRGERNDSSSLEQERAGNNLLSPPCPVLHCLSFAVPLALAPFTSPNRRLHLLSLSLSPSLLRSQRCGAARHRPCLDRRSGGRSGLCHPVFNHCSGKIPGQA